MSAHHGSGNTWSPFQPVRSTARSSIGASGASKRSYLGLPRPELGGYPGTFLRGPRRLLRRCGGLLLRLLSLLLLLLPLLGRTGPSRSRSGDRLLLGLLAAASCSCFLLVLLPRLVPFTLLAAALALPVIVVVHCIVLLSIWFRVQMVVLQSK